MFNSEIEKEWRQMGTLRNNKKAHYLLIFVIVSNMCLYICLLTSHILLIFRLLSLWHRSMYVWAAPHTNSSLLLKEIPTSDFFF